MKPEYRIEKWSIIDGYFGPGKHLLGHIQGHPRCTPGKLHVTSRIVRIIDDDVMETENSIYHLGEVDGWFKQFERIKRGEIKNNSGQ
jgi:hypothetical protein